jgi:hypothetical protein
MLYEERLMRATPGFGVTVCLSVTLLALAVSMLAKQAPTGRPETIVPGAKAVNIPIGPGEGFPMIGIALGETARISALNTGPNGPAPPGAATPGGCQVTLQFYGADGQLLKGTVIPNLEPGRAAVLDLSSDDLAKRNFRTQLRAVLLFGYSGGAPPRPEILWQLQCNILPSLEIFDNKTGRTSIILTDAKPLPWPGSPPQ